MTDVSASVAAGADITAGTTVADATASIDFVAQRIEPILAALEALGLSSFDDVRQGLATVQRALGSLGAL